MHTGARGPSAAEVRSLSWYGQRFHPSPLFGQQKPPPANTPTLPPPHVAIQILGAIFGALIYAALIPALHLGAGAGSPGCFSPTAGVKNGDVFGWEVMMTFLLVMTVYAAAVAKPGHGNTAPLAIGLSLYAAAISGGCRWSDTWVTIEEYWTGTGGTAALQRTLYNRQRIYQSESPRTGFGMLPRCRPGVILETCMV